MNAPSLSGVDKRKCNTAPCWRSTVTASRKSLPTPGPVLRAIKVSVMVKRTWAGRGSSKRVANVSRHVEGGVLEMRPAKEMSPNLHHGTQAEVSAKLLRAKHGISLGFTAAACQHAEG